MFFWDQRADTLEDQVLMPFQDAVEMGMTLETLVAAVEDRDFYAPLFDAAFGNDGISADTISKALAQFVRSLVSYQSPYDIGRAEVSSAKTDFPSFSDQENFGKEIFMGTPMDTNGAGCAVCHTGESMSAAEATNNGLDIDSETDAGYGDVTGSGGDMGTFKVPSLRNISVRGGFMHDGRFATLAEVIGHYGDTVLDHENLSVPLSMHVMDLSDEHRDALLAFLETLTDETMLNDPKFATPFDEDGELVTD
jgi:cytochrome c peroxidase